jgi:hypothetical protein
MGIKIFSFLLQPGGMEDKFLLTGCGGWSRLAG